MDEPKKKFYSKGNTMRIQIKNKNKKYIISKIDEPKKIPF